jgi:aminoglycoside phosphotransferase (APT) family kinase protein
VQELPLTGGWVNNVVRVGDTVRRPVGPWTPAVHALLRHLEAAGFDECPRVLGLDDQGREVLTYIEGESATRPWPDVLLQDAGIEMLAGLLRRYHDAVADFVPSPGAVWRVGAVPLLPGQVIRHGDFGPWNTIWREGRLVGLIDWDFAEPGPAIFDLAQLAWFGVPLSDGGGVANAGFSSAPDLSNRLRVITETYGSCTVVSLLDAVEAVQRIDLQRTEVWGAQGKEPWAFFLRAGDAARIRSDMAWLNANRAALQKP